jgi:hypothetical protein
MARNQDTFRAVYEALAGGSAVAVFPEGTSHSEPGMVPLKTGAARIALGAAGVIGGPFPIVPVGLVFRAKDTFRSGAHVVVGAPVEWSDLATRTEQDAEAVRELTERIATAIRAVTLNLARWEDEAVIRAAEAIWAAERHAERTPAARVERLGRATEALASLRADGDARWAELAMDVEEHARMLAAFGLRPADVAMQVDAGAAARWALRRLRLTALAQIAIAAVAMPLFWIPYRVTAFVTRTLASGRDVISTYNVLGGALVFALWIALVAGLVGVLFGWIAAALAFVALPVVAVAGQYCVERWRRTLLRARRWLILRRRGEHVAPIRARQEDLAHRLDEALATHDAIS